MTSLCRIQEISHSSDGIAPKKSERSAGNRAAFSTSSRTGTAESSSQAWPHPPMMIALTSPTSTVSRKRAKCSSKVSFAL